MISFKLNNFDCPKFVCVCSKFSIIKFINIKYLTHRTRDQFELISTINLSVILLRKIYLRIGKMSAYKSTGFTIPIWYKAILLRISITYKFFPITQLAF